MRFQLFPVVLHRIGKWFGERIRKRRIYLRKCICKLYCECFRFCNRR